MYAKQEAIQEVLTSLKKVIGKGFITSPDILEVPPDDKMGDLAFPCFELAKLEGRNPVEIAKEIAVKIGPSELIESIKPVGPYVNFIFSSEKMTERVLGEVLTMKDEYGNAKTGEGKTVMVEYAQPNTHKEFHVGHVRNALLGQSIVNLLRTSGFKVISASYIGDIGAHVAKVVWALNKFHQDEDFDEETRAKRLGEIYTEATKMVDDNPDLKEEIDEVQRKLEAGEEPWKSLWKETREWSLKEFKNIFSELGVHPDVWYFESEVEEPGKEFVKKLLTKGVAMKSQGATIIDLDDADLGAFLILKSDGSSLYATKDLALAFKKDEEYNPDRQIFVVDNRQSFYFQQLFAGLKKAGFSKHLQHLSYDMVNLPEGTMSSRSGNIVTYTDLRDKMIARLVDETKLRHDDWSDKKIEQTASAIAFSALDFMMLRQDSDSIITFDMDEALSFDGFSGPYILYTVARIESILSKTKIKPKVNAEVLNNEMEIKLIKKIADYPIVLQDSSATFYISAIARWMFEISKMFAEYYHEVKIINEDEKDLTASRLALILAVKLSLEHAGNILGMKIIKEM